MGSVLDALRAPAFADGLRPGLIALAVGLIAALAWRATGESAHPPVVGLLLGAAVLFGLSSTGWLPDGLVVGLSALGIAGLVAEVNRTRPLVLAVLAVPGAWVVVAQGGLVEVGWVQLLVGAAIVAGSVALADLDARWADEGAGPVLVAVTAAAIWATVPETQQALVLLGASVPLCLLGWPRVAGALGAGGSCVVVGLLAWTGAVGGATRLSSVIGAIGCLGLLLVEPLWHRLAGVPDGPLDRLWGRWWAVLVLAFLHLAVALTAGTYAGQQRTIAVAGWITATALAGTLLAGAVAGRRMNRELEVSRQGGRPLV